MSYLVIPRIRIQTANIFNAGFLMGGSPVLPSFFFSHAMGRKAGFNVEGVALIHHSMTPLGQRFFGVFSPQQRRAAAFVFSNKPYKDYSSSNKQALSFQPVANAHMRLSLVIKTTGLRSLEGVREVLHAGRFSGGVIIAHGEPRICQAYAEAMESITTGFFVMDRKDLLKCRDGKNQAQLFVEELGRSWPVDSGKSWLSATCLGYATISKFERREGVREGYSHAFAEPLVGMVQYSPVRTFSGNADSVFWRPQWLDHDIFRVQQEIEV